MTPNTGPGAAARKRFPPGILVSCVVPWDARERLLESVFRTEIRRIRSHGFTHLYIFGTGGEGHAVDTSRFREVASVFREETRDPGVVAQVGVIALSAANVVERLRIAYDLGFRIFQIALPSWGVLSDSELVRFFEDVCLGFPDCRFVHYNVTRSGRLLDGAEYRRLADRIPNLAATKITGKDRQLACDVMRKAPELQHFFVQMYAEGCAYGECSLLGVLAPMCPARVKQLFEYGQTGNREALLALDAALRQMDAEVLAPARQYGLIDGAFDKLRVRLGGVRDFPMRLLSPYETFDDETVAACQRILNGRYPGWTD